MRRIAVAAAGGLLGMVLIRVGFNIRLGPSLWIGAPWAYPLSLVIGSLIALAVDHVVQIRS